MADPFGSVAARRIRPGFRLRGERGWSHVAELKWDYLWHQIWDALKIAHALRIPQVRAGFLVAIATEREWAKPAECVELYEDETLSIDALLTRYDTRWKMLVAKSAKSGPQAAPEFLEFRRVADVPLATKYGASRLRIAAVRPIGDWGRLGDVSSAEDACPPSPSTPPENSIKRER